MIVINMTDARQLQARLGAIRSRGIPFAIRATQNGMAFKAQSLARDTVKETMTTRNQFATRSIQVDRARAGRNYSTVGSTAGFMATQEFGGTVSDPTITTQYASGEGFGSSAPRKRLARGANKLSRIRLRNRQAKGKNRKQRNIAKIADAVTSGKRYVFLDLGRTEGIFKIVGGSKKNPQRAKLRMVHRTDLKSVSIQRRPWLAPAVRQLAPHVPALYAKALQHQLDRT